MENVYTFREYIGIQSIEYINVVAAEPSLWQIFVRIVQYACTRENAIPVKVRRRTSATYLSRRVSRRKDAYLSLSLSLSLALSRVSSYVTRYIEPSLSNSAACKNAESTWLDNELRSFRWKRYLLSWLSETIEDIPIEEERERERERVNLYIYYNFSFIYFIYFI